MARPPMDHEHPHMAEHFAAGHMDYLGDFRSDLDKGYCPGGDAEKTGRFAAEGADEDRMGPDTDD